MTAKGPVGNLLLLSPATLSCSWTGTWGQVTGSQEITSGSLSQKQPCWLPAGRGSWEVAAISPWGRGEKWTLGCSAQHPLGPCTKQKSGFPPSRAEQNSLCSVPGLLAALLPGESEEGDRRKGGHYFTETQVLFGPLDTQRRMASGTGLCLPHPHAQALMFLINITTIKPFKLLPISLFNLFTSEVELLSTWSFWLEISLLRTAPSSLFPFFRCLPFVNWFGASPNSPDPNPLSVNMLQIFLSPVFFF